MVEELHVGRDGISMRGRDTIIIGVLVLSLMATGWLVWDRDWQLESRVSVLNADHVALASALKAQTEVLQQNGQAIRDLAERVNEQNWLMISTPEQDKRARQIMGTPKRFRD